MTNEVVMIICPPHSDYPEAPTDQSHSELFDCPECKNKMWISYKKRGVLAFASCVDKDIILACYHCFTEMVKNEDDLIKELTKPKPKYEVGQEVYVLHGDQIRSFFIHEIINDDDEIWYTTKYNYGYFSNSEYKFTEKFLYPSRKSLIDTQIKYWTELREQCDE